MLNRYAVKVIGPSGNVAWFSNWLIPDSGICTFVSDKADAFAGRFGPMNNVAAILRRYYPVVQVVAVHE